MKKQPEIDVMLDDVAVGRLLGGDDKPVHRGTIWRMVKEERFPPPVEIGPCCKRWFLSEVRAWLAERPRRTYRAPEEAA
jgi:hypothetical protein